MIDLVRKYCTEVVKTPRDLNYIFTHLDEEVRELEEEVYHYKSNTPGEDGVFGESIDVILCAFDLIFKDNPDITNDEIMTYTLKKLEKWKNKNGSLA